MSISLTNESQIFNNKQNLIILFSAFSGEISWKKRENYVFIYNKTNMIGINVFDYKNDFDNIKEGYHNFSNENFLKISKKFPSEMKFAKNDSFFRIGIVKEIKNHPKSENLKILFVETRDKKELIIITSVSNLTIGNRYLFAINQAFLGNGMIVSESKIMGIQSEGMICSYKSIGIEREGIIRIENCDITEEFDF